MSATPHETNPQSAHAECHEDPGSPDKYSDQEIFQAYEHAKKLRHLMICHDRAVQQIVLLDSRIRDMTKRHHYATCRDTTRPHAVTLRIEERLYLYRWMRETYAEYRTRKWLQVQNMISNMFNGFVPDMINNIIALAVSSRGTDDGDEISEESEIEVSFVSYEEMSFSDGDGSLTEFQEDRDT